MKLYQVRSCLLGGYCDEKTGGLVCFVGNKMKTKVKRKSRPIVVGHLEKVGRGVFRRFQKQITECVKGSFGVYALYRQNTLYYIGLASDLKRRIKWHLKDKHKGKWDRFSLYIIRKTDHIREVESVVVRIAEQNCPPQSEEHST